jgi:hypothetical protein
MCRALVMLFCLAVLVANHGFAEEANLPGAPRPAPVRALTSGSSGDITDKSPDKTIDHLLKAADHLDAAGLSEQADRLRNDARRRALREDLLGRKESELECLQEEVDRLRALTRQASGVRIEIVAVDVDPKGLGLKARDFEKMIGLSSSRTLDSSLQPPGIHPATRKRAETLTFGIVEADPSRLPLFKELVEEGFVNVLARPTLMTTSGRPASMHIGGEIPVRVQSSGGEVSIRSLPFGTHVDVLATVLPNHGIRLRMAFEKREINPEKTIGDDGTSYPEVQSRRINTELELKLGQTVVLAGLIAQRRVESETAEDDGAGKGTVRPAAKSNRPSDTTQTIVFITPELVHSPIVPRALHGVPEPDETEDQSSELIEPAVFESVDWDLFGPPVPVLRRRASRD